MTTQTKDFLQQFAKVNAVSKAWRTKEPMDEITLGWWDNDSLINFALDFDQISALNTDDLHALIYELASRLDATLND